MKFWGDGRVVRSLLGLMLHPGKGMGWEEEQEVRLT
jgi:hypothetical protein